MKVITNITTNSKLNAKAADLALLVRLYKQCLFPTDDIFDGFVAQLRKVINDLNEKYPRTKPFEIYSVTEWNICIAVQGSPDKIVAVFSISTIKCFTDNEEILPIENLIIINNINEH
jgi:hypothetical protein